MRCIAFGRWDRLRRDLLIHCICIYFYMYSTAPEQLADLYTALGWAPEVPLPPRLGTLMWWPLAQVQRLERTRHQIHHHYNLPLLNPLLLAPTGRKSSLHVTPPPLPNLLGTHPPATAI